MAEVMCQTSGVNDVGIRSERCPELPADLSALERMCQPGPREVVDAYADNLRLGGESAKGRTVQHTGAVSFVRGARQTCCFALLGGPARCVVLVVRRSHQPEPNGQSRAQTARGPASKDRWNIR